MGTMTLLDLRNDLKDASGRATIDPNRLDRMINNAMFEFAYAFQFPELEAFTTINLVQATDNYAMPADFRSMNEAGVRITSPQERFGGILAAESRTEYLRRGRYPITSNQNAVGAYHMYGNKIYVRPVPDGTVTVIGLDYWKRVPKLANATDITIFEDDWDDVLFRGALYRIHMVYGEHDRMINIFNMYLGLLRSRLMDSDLQEFPEGGISAIQSSFDNLRR